MQFQSRLEEVERRYDELTAQMADPAVISDSAQYRKVSKSQSDLFDQVAKYREWKTATKNLAEARLMLAETEPGPQGHGAGRNRPPGAGNRPLRRRT